MNNTINIKLKYLLLFAVVFLLVLGLHFFNNNVPEDKTVITTKKTTEIIKKVDSASVTISTKKPVETIPYLIDTITGVARKKPSVKKSLTVHQPKIKPETKKPVSEKATPPKKETEKEVIANVHKETIKLKNATAKIKLISTGRVLGIDLKLFTKDKLIKETKAIKVTKYIIPNAWFINFEPNFTVFPTPAFVGGNVSVDYTIKGRFRFGAGVGYSNLTPTNNRFFINGKIGLKL